MTEEQAAQAREQAREFPQTMEIMGRIRAALAERLFKTAVLASKEREEIYIRVTSLDAMRSEMENLLAGIASEAEMKKYAESFATTDPE